MTATRGLRVDPGREIHTHEGVMLKKLFTVTVLGIAATTGLFAAGCASNTAVLTSPMP